jgi:hypothetical protein
MILFFLAGLSGLGFMAGVFVYAFGGPMYFFGMAAMAFMTLLWAGAGLVLQRFLPHPQQQQVMARAEKAKRGATDMYSLIDRLVDELTPDERRYLEQRLGDAPRDDGEDLSTTLEALLSQREENRLSE